MEAFHGWEVGVDRLVRRVLLFSLSMLSGVYAGSLLDFTYGVLEEGRGNGEKAIAFYQSAYEADPSAMPLVRLIAARRMKENDRVGALQAYQDAIAGRPDDISVQIEYGDFLGQVGRGDSLAEKLRREAYEKVLEAMPGDYLPIERLIRLAREQGNDDRARELLEQLETDSPEALNYYVASTKSLYDSRDVEAAKRIDACFEKAMHEHPEWPGITRKASDHFRGSGRLEQAIEIIGKHLEVRPTSLDLKIRLGILMFSAKRAEDGLRILKEVLAIHPRKALAHESLAKYYRMNGKTEEAREHAAELLKIRGGTPGEFLKLADEMIADGDFRAARLLLEKAAFFHQEDAALRMKLAIATSRDAETKDKAGRLFREAEALVADSGEMDPGFLIESAKELVAQGQSKAAEERLRTAIRSFPKNAKKETAQAMRALAEIWISEGRNLDAAKALNKRADALGK